MSQGLILGVQISKRSPKAQDMCTNSRHYSIYCYQKTRKNIREGQNLKVMSQSNTLIPAPSLKMPGVRKYNSYNNVQCTLLFPLLQFLLIIIAMTFTQISYKFVLLYLSTPSSTSSQSILNYSYLLILKLQILTDSIFSTIAELSFDKS